MFLAVVVILGGHFGSVASSIRYGFLAVAFTKREIPGNMYGFVEGSIFFGYMAGYFCTSMWNRLTARITPKWMIVFTLGLSSLALSISLMADFTDNNTIFIAVSILGRVLHGFAAFPHNVCCLDILKTLFPHKFDLVTGLMQMGYFSGHGVGEFSGTSLYENFGYKVPFMFATSVLTFGTIINLIFLPACPSIAVADGVKDEKKGDLDDSSDETSISYLVFFPAFACMLINCVYMYLQIATAPYLYEKFNIPLTVGGSVLVTVSAGVAIGSSLSGMLAQSKIIDSYTQMIIGSAMVALGLLAMFPSPYFSLIYNYVPYIAYPSALLAGVGDPIITIPTLRAMTNLQISIKGKCTGKNEVGIFGIWMMGTSCAAYSGALVGGVLIEYLSYYNAAYLLAALCCVSLVTSAVIKTVLGVVSKISGDEERVQLLSGSLRVDKYGGYGESL